MSNAISHVPAQANTQAVHAQPIQHAAPTQKTPQVQAPSTNNRGQDTVQISQGAQQALAALKEATESSAQTAQEANHGDHQAQRLLAKEQAAKET